MSEPSQWWAAVRVAKDHQDEVEYRDDLRGVDADQLVGFFEGWPRPPSPQEFLQMLSAASYVGLARQGGRTVGFISANSDGMNAAIPLLEVLPEARGRGIGSTLVARMLDRLSDHYAVDIVCDDDLVPFYERFGLVPLRAMVLRAPSNASSATG